jgi:hypothetical protein
MPERDIHTVRSPLYTADQVFQFESGAVFLPELHVDERGRNAPRVRFWDKDEGRRFEHMEVDLSVLMTPENTGRPMTIRHPNPAFDGQAISFVTRVLIVQSALHELRKYPTAIGRYRVVWEDWTQLQPGWPDPEALAAELRFLFPSLVLSRSSGAQKTAPWVVESAGTTASGNPLFDGIGSVEPSVDPGFSAWLESRGFTVAFPIDADKPEIYIAAFLSSMATVMEEETGWWFSERVEGPVR